MGARVRVRVRVRVRLTLRVLASSSSATRGAYARSSAQQKGPAALMTLKASFARRCTPRSTGAGRGTSSSRVATKV